MKSSILLVLLVWPLSCQMPTGSGTDRRVYTLDVPEISEDNGQPTQIPPDLDRNFQIRIADPDEQVAMLQLQSDSDAIVVSGDQVVSGQVNLYQLTNIGLPDPVSKLRTAPLTIRLKEGFTSGTLRLTVYADREGNQALSVHQKTFHLKKADLPQLTTIKNGAISSQQSAPTLLTLGVYHPLDIHYRDPARWVTAVRLTFSVAVDIYQGKEQASGTQFLLTGLAEEPVAHFRLQLSDSRLNVLTVELLGTEGQSFQPPLTKVFYLKGDASPSLPSLVQDGKRELSQSTTTPTAFLPGMPYELVLTVVDPQQQVSTVDLTVAGVTLAPIHASSGDQATVSAITNGFRVAQLSEPMPDSGIRRAHLSLTLNGAGTGGVFTLGMELKESGGGSFSPAIGNTYQLSQATLPSQLQLSYQGAALSQDSSHPTALPADSPLLLEVRDPSLVVAGVTLNHDPGIILTGDQLFYDSQSNLHRHDLPVPSDPSSQSRALPLTFNAGSTVTGDGRISLKVTQGHFADFSPSITTTYYVKVKA